MSDKIYEVNLVSKGYEYWKRKLHEKVLTLYKWEGLPNTLPYKELETRLCTDGWVGVFKHKKYGIVCCSGGISGVSIYNHPTFYTYAQPKLGSGVLEIGKNCVIIYNNFYDRDVQNGLTSIIERYARMLADVESSLNISIINSRMTNLVEGKTEGAYKSIVAYQNEIQKGKLSAVSSNNAVFDNVRVQPCAPDGYHTIDSLSNVRRSILTDFYEEIGIHHTRNKTAEMTAEEVQEDKSTLVLNKTGMLEERVLGANRINEMFGTDITVRMREEYE